MQKLAALVAHLVAARVVKPEQLRGVLESGDPQASFNQYGPDLLLFRHRYTARVVLEQTPHDLTHVLACTYAWLEEHGDDSTDALLGWVGEPADDRLGDVDLRLQFEEQARYVPKPPDYTGRDVVTWRGDDYVPGEQAAGVADDLVLEGEAT